MLRKVASMLPFLSFSITLDHPLRKERKRDNAGPQPLAAGTFKTTHHIRPFTKNKQSINNMTIMFMVQSHLLGYMAMHISWVCAWLATIINCTTIMYSLFPFCDYVAISLLFFCTYFFVPSRLRCTQCKCNNNNNNDIFSFWFPQLGYIACVKHHARTGQII